MMPLPSRIRAYQIRKGSARRPSMNECRITEDILKDGKLENPATGSPGLGKKVTYGRNLNNGRN